MGESYSEENDWNVLDSDFYPRAFGEAVRLRKRDPLSEGDEWWLACVEEYGSLSERVERSGLQDAAAVRNTLRARRFAYLLIDENGELFSSLLPRRTASWRRHLYSLGPKYESDGPSHRHILHVLELLQSDKEAARLLRKISKPYANKIAEQIIRDTLELPPHTAVTDAHARRAALSAWLSSLRQNVGSCFATAPALILQREQPAAFLRDIDELLCTGRLKRTFGGIEYSAPLSSTWGAGDLKRPLTVPRREEFASEQLWLSPGLLAAFTAMKMIEEELPLKERIQSLRMLLNALLLKWNEGGELLQINVEMILRRALLQHIGLTEGDLLEYEQRAQGTVQTSLLRQVPHSAIGSGGKGERCSHYIELLTEGMKAFKRFAENALLKSWEYTLASFAETKATFSRWNFYASLGLNPDDGQGIGPSIYMAVQKQLERLNQEVREHQEEYDRIYGQVRYLEVRIRSVSSEQEGQWLRSELRSAVNEFRSAQQMRDTAHQKAQRVSQLYKELVEVYEAAFPRYFQEVYDADLHEVNVGPYDDSPAGFRLVYKYGRSNTSQWTPIHNASEFVECLVSFFIATETEIISLPSFEGMQDIVTHIISDIVPHVRTREFLESAFQRMAAVHGVPLIANPLDHLDQVEKKPWVYTSGGSMDSLLCCYYGLEHPPTKVARWVENTLELATFLVDSLKQMPHAEISQWRQEGRISLLMHSPTHAFLCQPLSSLMQEATAADAFTYTWIRDKIAIPFQRFVANVVLNEEKMYYLIDRCAERIPINYRLYFKGLFDRFYGTMDPMQFRSQLLERVEGERGLAVAGIGVISATLVDSVLYANIPLIVTAQLPECIEVLLRALPHLDEKTIGCALSLLSAMIPQYGSRAIFGAKAVRDIAKGLLCLVSQKPTSAEDNHALLVAAAQRHDLAMPTPLLFADTNWPRSHFAFTANPGNGLFELWRTDYTGSEGEPMSAWRHWLDGSRQKQTWGLYTRPHEYYLRTHRF